MVGKDDTFIESIWFSDETMVKSRPKGEVIFFRSAKNSQWFVPSNEGASEIGDVLGLLVRGSLRTISGSRGKKYCC
jgi:hypothetical protein